MRVAGVYVGGLAAFDVWKRMLLVIQEGAAAPPHSVCSPLLSNLYMVQVQHNLQGGGRMCSSGWAVQIRQLQVAPVCIRFRL